MYRHAAIFAGLLLLATGVAAAQTTPTQPPGPAAKAPCAPGGGNGGTTGSGDSGQNLSEKLSGSNGVICPPNNIDESMQKPAPGGGRMKVIPPPGGPGGDRNTVPK